MPNLVTELLSQEYEREFQSAESLLLLGMGGLTVAESEGLRGSLSAQGVKLVMVKNSLAKRALSQRGLEFPDGTIAGNVGIAYGAAEAAIHAAKIFTTPEVRKAGKIEVRAGMLSGEVLGKADANALADVPDQRTLRAQLVGVIQAPARGLATILAALPSGMARVIKAHAEQGGGDESAAAG